MTADKRPAGLVLIGIAMVAFGVISAMIAVGLAGSAVTFDDPQPAWLAPIGAAIGFILGFFAIRVGFGLLRGPQTGRRQGEIALWVGIPASLWVLWAINWLLTGGANDVTLWFLAPLGVLGVAMLIAAALYMRSGRARTYFNQK